MKTFTEQHSKNISIAKKGNIKAKGKKWKVKDSSRMGRWDRRGRKLSEKHKESIRQGNIGKTITSETRQKLSLSRIGQVNPMQGRKHRTASIQKMREYQVTHPNRKFKNTHIELKMKEILDKLGVNYICQHPLEKIAIVDFYIPSKNLVIECDGCYYHGCPIHFPNSNVNRRVKDEIRDSRLKGLGYKVIRFWEHELNPLKLRMVNSGSSAVVHIEEIVI